MAAGAGRNVPRHPPSGGPPNSSRRASSRSRGLPVALFEAMRSALRTTLKRRPSQAGVSLRARALSKSSPGTFVITSMRILSLKSVIIGRMADRISRRIPSLYTSRQKGHIALRRPPRRPAGEWMWAGCADESASHRPYEPIRSEMGTSIEAPVSKL